ncbi:MULTISPECIES: hypothetical protein [Arthrobacter]|uniref:Alkaline shock response membrane anchor protein AmaP n=2 Tax=Arthrobacter TaxID=1663 RepID=A0ABU9KI54_9MICC|nr:hypothetical protein [Arthrobacter sp. YJM1]MDP5226428.1 hypothetical protein [Arthrobacter sp. YJM1]
MNGTPRGLNRFITGLLGLLLLLLGLGILLVSLVPPVAQAWRDFAAPLVRGLHGAYEATPLPAGSSWLYVVVAVVLLSVILLTIRWIAGQGQGRASLLVERPDHSATDGEVTISGNVAEQLLRAALSGRGDLLGLHVVTYQYRGITALRVRLFPRKGASPQKLVQDVESLLEGLDLMVGHHTPVLVHLGAGTRAMFTREERVR